MFGKELKLLAAESERLRDQSKEISLIVEEEALAAKKERDRQLVGKISKN